MKMWKVGSLVMVLLLCVASAVAQQSLAPTKDEATRLELKQKGALLDVAQVQILELKLQAARERSARSYRDLVDESQAVISAHKWSAKFEPDSLQFVSQPPQVEPKPEAKPAK